MRDYGDCVPPPSAQGGLGRLPLVSLMILTCNRPGFLELSLRAAFAQDYLRRGPLEAVVIDDGPEPVPSTGSRRARGYEANFSVRVRVVRVPARSTIGHKRNVAVREARGRVIVHWDDDDMHPPEQARTLPSPQLAPASCPPTRALPPSSRR